jgi:hypothetical protein
LIANLRSEPSLACAILRGGHPPTERNLVSRRVTLLLALTIPMAGAALTTVSASADPVTVTNDAGCRHVYVGSKEVTPSNGVCYLGPPAPTAIAR